MWRLSIDLGWGRSNASDGSPRTAQSPKAFEGVHRVSAVWRELARVTKSSSRDKTIRRMGREREELMVGLEITQRHEKEQDSARILHGGGRSGGSCGSVREARADQSPLDKPAHTHTHHAPKTVQPKSGYHLRDDPFPISIANLPRQGPNEQVSIG